MRLDKCLRKPVQTKKKNTKKLSSSPAMKKQSEVHRRFATGLRKQTIELKYFWHFYGLLQKRLWHFLTEVVSQPCKTFCMEEMQVDFGGSNHLSVQRISISFFHHQKVIVVKTFFFCLPPPNAAKSHKVASHFLNDHGF